MKKSLVFALFLAGCGGGGDNDAGLGTGTPDATVVNANFCNGTPVAGTCAQGFFMVAAQCFFPAGACMYEDHKSGVTGKAYCFSDGSHLYSYFDTRPRDGGAAPAMGKWVNPDGKVCMTATTDGSTITFQLGSDTLAYDVGSGAVTCPDKTHVNIGKPPACNDIAVFDDKPASCAKGFCALPR